MSLVHCIYCSRAVGDGFSSTELEALLARSRAKNAAAGITGVLLYRDGQFFQVLEGDRRAVEDLFAVIAQDPRHSRVMQLVLKEIPHREFEDWSMGYPDVRPEDLDARAGLNDFFGSGRGFPDLDAGRTRTLLDALCGHLERRRIG